LKSYRLLFGSPEAAALGGRQLRYFIDAIDIPIGFAMPLGKTMPKNKLMVHGGEGIT
jgi:hypothetical protein